MLNRLAARARSSARLTVLLYHRIADDESDPLAVKPSIFEKQMEELSDQYELTNGAEVIAHQRTGERLDHSLVWVTFDDATLDHSEVAAPILIDRKIPATVFVPTASMGQGASWASSAAEAEKIRVLDAPALRSLAENGIELGFHSHAHRDFSQLSITAIQQDLVRSRETAEAAELPMVGALAYPFGRIPKTPAVHQQLPEVLRQQGISIALRVGTRSNRLPFSDPHALHRCRVTNDHLGARLNDLVLDPRRERRRARGTDSSE